MKTYIFTVKEKKEEDGYTEYIATIYRVKNNEPIFVTSCNYSSSFFVGHKSEVFHALIQIGEIPEKYKELSKNEWCDGGIYCEKVEKKGIQIIQL